MRYPKYKNIQNTNAETNQLKIHKIKLGFLTMKEKIIASTQYIVYMSIEHKRTFRTCVGYD